MAKSYTLDGPIILETLNSQDALMFCGAVIDAIPAYSMGTASLNIQAQGPAGSERHKISGNSTEELKASLAKAQRAPKGAEDITYNVNGRVSLLGLSLADGIQVIEAAMNAIPGDSLVLASMLAQEC